MRQTRGILGTSYFQLTPGLQDVYFCLSLRAVNKWNISRCGVWTTTPLTTMLRGMWVGKNTQIIRRSCLGLYFRRIKLHKNLPNKTRRRTGRWSLSAPTTPLHRRRNWPHSQANEQQKCLLEQENPQNSKNISTGYHKTEAPKSQKCIPGNYSQKQTHLTPLHVHSEEQLPINPN